MSNLNQQQQAIFDEMSMAEKIAILLLQVGEETTAGIFSAMSVDAITDISKYIATNTTVDRGVATAILEEFHAIFQSGQYLTAGGMEYARELLYRTLGPDEAKKVLEKLNKNMQNTQNFAYLSKLSRNNSQTLL